MLVFGMGNRRVCTVKGLDDGGMPIDLNVEASSVFEAAARGMEEMNGLEGDQTVRPGDHRVSASATPLNNSIAQGIVIRSIPDKAVTSPIYRPANIEGEISVQRCAGTNCDRCFGFVVATMIEPATRRACAASSTSMSRAVASAVGRPVLRD
jgi:hypothetical protein